jgi:septum formation protein
MSARPELVLASTSNHRRELLARLGLPFSALAPGVDETRESHEEPARLVMRLARAKAMAGLAQRPGAIVIGADQVAVRGEEVLGKPDGEIQAAEQLARSAGRQLEFLTGVCVVSGARPDFPEEHMDITRVVFRPLTPDEIRLYLQREQPWDCAGSFRSESLGIALLERIDGQDPTGLVGLPLIWLSGALGRLGLPVL